MFFATQVKGFCLNAPYVIVAGWQTRWFILDNGILSYYKSQEEVSQGCKGSVKVSVCQINGKLLLIIPI